MIFSDLPESSPPTVNTGYFDEILACSIFVCWSNISMMNHWRCPPSNPGNEKSDIKLQRWKKSLECRNWSWKSVRSGWQICYLVFYESTKSHKWWILSVGSEVRFNTCRRRTELKFDSLSTKVNTKAGVWWNDSIFDRRKSRTKVERSLRSNLYFGKSSRRNFSHFANV